jgi:nucleotide-binding universal stress UspA family protein
MKLRRRGLRVRSLLRVGIPHREITHMARQQEVDFIVMGTRGWSRLRGLLVGSVAARVIRSASCPVLTVGPFVRRPQHRGRRLPKKRARSGHR